jgi:hypothetical protein
MNWTKLDKGVAMGSYQKYQHKGFNGFLDI